VLVFEGGTKVQLDRARDARAQSALTAGELAWLAAAPCAVVVVLAIVVLGPPLGHAFLEPSSRRLWPAASTYGAPEPTEHARYLLAVLGPLLLAVCVAALARRTRTRSGPMAAGVFVSQALLLAFLALCVVIQRHMLFDQRYYVTPAHRAYFTRSTLVFALLFTAVLTVALRRRHVVAWVARACRETWSRHALALIVALPLTAAWLLTAINTERSAGTANGLAATNFPLLMDEPFAVLDHLLPLVSFHATYGELWICLAALAMSVFGTSFGVYSVVMALGSAVISLAVFATLRRLVHSSLIALVLYAPVLATGFFTEAGPPANRYGPTNLFSLFPMRYGGAYILAWLTARSIDGARPRRPILLFLAAGLVLVNNIEFGLPALGATLGAFLLTTPRSSLVRLAGDVAIGLLGAIALVAALTLTFAGSLPHFGMLLTLPQLFSIDGYGMLPMPTIGFHLAIYVTFVAAIVLAVVRAIDRDEERLITGMLAWSGIFGLGVAAYYAGRSHPDVLIGVFSAWALALATLCVATVRAILRRPGRWPRPAELAVLFGFGIAICSLAQTPDPRSQIDRMRQLTPEPMLKPTAQEQFIAKHIHDREAVAIIAPLGHRIAYDTGADDVVGYGGPEMMPTQNQWDETVAALRAAGGRKLFISLGNVQKEAVTAIKRIGFTRTIEEPATTLTEFTAPP
jgi:hypothetical protein